MAMSSAALTPTPTLARHVGEGAIERGARNSVPSPATAGEGQGEGVGSIAGERR